MTETRDTLIGHDDPDEQVTAPACKRVKGPLSEDDTGEITTDDRLDALREENRRSEGHDEDYDDEDEDEEGGLLELIGEHWIYVVGALAAIVVLYIGVSWAFGGGGQTKASPENAPAAQGSGQVEDTGVIVQKPTIEDDGTYYLQAGSIAWKGEIEKTDDGDELTVEGATAAQFKRAVNLPHGAITTGVFGRAEPDEPVIHGTFHRTTIGEEETTTGTYHAMDANRVLVEGKYQDKRDGETVNRTYTEQAPGGAKGQQPTTYQVSFQAPKDVPIPALIGWKPPAMAAEGQK